MPTQLPNNLSRWPMRDQYNRNRVMNFLEWAGPDALKIIDDFTGPVIDTNRWTVGNGAGASAASPAIDVGKVGGQIKFVTGTANDNTAASTLAGGRHFRGDGFAVIQARLNINSAVTSVKVEVGFRDAITTTAGASQVVNVMATPTFVATDGAVWCYDTNNGSAGWQGLGVANGTAAVTDTGYNVIPVADTFETLQVMLIDGVAWFSRYTAKGVRDYGPKAVAAAVTKTVLLSPHIYVEARSATSRTVDVDYVYAYGGRTTD